MAPGTRARRQRDVASTLRPSVEAASDITPPLSNSNNRRSNRESNSTGHELDKTEDPQRGRVLFTPEPKPYDPETYGAWGRKHFGEEWYEYRNTLLREGKTYALVSGVQMIISQTYDPDTYDPDGRMPWTPEPEPYDPEAYATWGRKHFGEE
jgi:protoporphyrinogen oxidase